MSFTWADVSINLGRPVRAEVSLGRDVCLPDISYMIKGFAVLQCMCACCTNHKDDARTLYHLRPNEYKIGKSAIGTENDINISTII